MDPDRKYCIDTLENFFDKVREFIFQSTNDVNILQEKMSGIKMF